MGNRRTEFAVCGNTTRASSHCTCKHPLIIDTPIETSRFPDWNRTWGYSEQRVLTFRPSNVSSRIEVWNTNQ